MNWYNSFSSLIFFFKSLIEIFKLLSTSTKTGFAPERMIVETVDK